VRTASSGSRRRVGPSEWEQTGTCPAVDVPGVAPPPCQPPTSSDLYAQHHPTRPESLPPHTERSSRPRSELPSVKADVYVWQYALLVVHNRKESYRIVSALWAQANCLYAHVYICNRINNTNKTMNNFYLRFPRMVL